MRKVKSTNNNNLNRRSKMRSKWDKPGPPGSHNPNRGVPTIHHTPFGTRVTSYGKRGTNDVKTQGSWKRGLNSVSRGFRRLRQGASSLMGGGGRRRRRVRGRKRY